jgi:hypothetical protein
MIKSRRRRWVEHVAHMGKRKIYTEFWLGNMKEEDYY